MTLHISTHANHGHLSAVISPTFMRLVTCAPFFWISCEKSSRGEFPSRCSYFMLFSSYWKSSPIPNIINIHRWGKKKNIIISNHIHIYVSFFQYPNLWKKTSHRCGKNPWAFPMKMIWANTVVAVLSFHPAPVGNRQVSKACASTWHLDWRMRVFHPFPMCLVLENAASFMAR